MTRDVVRVALLGVGKMGQNHLRILSMLKDVEIVCIFDSNESELKKYSEMYHVPYATDIAEAIGGADAVVVVTPTSTHFEYFKICSDSIKNIFIEKPLAASVVEALKIQEIVNEKNINLQVGFVERFNPVVIGLKTILDQEQVINCDFTRTNRLSNRISDVDVVLDLMIHDLDLAVYLNGPVESVSSYGARENGFVAFACAVLCHKGGAFSRVMASRITEKKMRQIQVTTESSFIDAELLRKEIVINKQSEVFQEEGKPYTISSLEQKVEVKPQEALLVELQEFIKLCSGEVAGVPDVDAGVDALVLSEKILEQIE